MNPHNRLDLTMWLDGYRPGAPSAEAEAIDREMVDNSPCGECDGPCYYEPFSKPGSYRAFAVCLICGHEEEF